MKHLSLFGWLSLVFIFSAALTCNDHRDQPAPRFRLKTVNYVKPNDAGAVQNGLYILSYDSNGRLLSFSNERFLTLRFKTASITYDANDRINSSYRYLTPTAIPILDYSFDNQNRPTRIRLNYGSDYKVVYDFTYAGNSTTPSSRTTTRIENGTPIGTKTETYTFVGNNATTINGNAHTYDSSPNPYKGLFGFNAIEYLSPDYFSSGSITELNRPFNISENFSDSSVKIFNQNNRTTNAQLTYGSNGLVTKITYTDGNSEEFTYETY
ncbi:hypothetical protein [Fibrella aquatilis]|uniref:YD repeat-containing protein n=1 Tax=Fibrella aquatilis TaxID=2817059 RepID=A0A939JXJ2_9BACT|nr:hypothetical protein [Fibrella aquatilis]MBO0931089.1 hypothetical protein [Fibrella aquatilis]